MSEHAEMIERRINHEGTMIPTFIYGTAWKEEQTEKLTQAAIQSGFLGVDTANQRRHYHEAGVGRAVQGVLADHGVTREDLFLQSKFTYLTGQDHRLPYDPEADLTIQVRQSFESSLEHLGISYLDSYILHGPSVSRGLSEGDWDVWKEMENLYKSGRVKCLGVSNISFEQLKLLIEKAAIKPVMVQNRCFARTKWDRQIRGLCRANNILYQGFSLLTANTMDLNHPVIFNIARRHRCSIPQMVFRFAMEKGMIPLTGTTSLDHMKEDMAVYDMALEPKDLEAIENISFL